MSGDTMTPRERWTATLERRKPDRTPMDYWATPEVTERLKEHLGVKNLKEMYERLHIDAVATVYPKYVGPRPPKGSDVYGCRYRTIRYKTGTYDECIFNPLAAYKTLGEVKKHARWETVDMYDYSVIPDQIKSWEDHPVRGGGSEPFLTYKNLRGMRQAYLDLYMHPDIVHYCLDQLFDFCYENTKLIYEQIPGEVMLSYVAEDFGCQTGLLISPKHLHEFFIPRMKRMIDLAHSNGVYAFHHSDGSIRKIIPDLIEAGVDILNPIQWRCKDMNREDLKQEFGGKLVFHGAMDNQYTLAFGTEQEVRREVLDNLRILGDGGGYILAPCHNIQPVTPIENVLAMYDEGYRKGRVN